MKVTISRQAAVLTVSAAAELAGMHPQTLRQYDRLGLVRASRTRGGGRRYSLADVEKLQEVQRLSQVEGINIAGIYRILDLETENEQLRARLVEAEKRVAELEVRLDASKRVFAASAAGDVVVLPRGHRLQVQRHSNAVVVWQPPLSSI